MTSQTNTAHNMPTLQMHDYTGSIPRVGLEPIASFTLIDQRDFAKVTQAKIHADSLLPQPDYSVLDATDEER